MTLDLAPALLAPAVDLALLDRTPTGQAPSLTAVEHCDLPALLAAALPGVVHHRHRDVAPLVDEHVFVEAAAGAAVKAVMWFDLRWNSTFTQVAEIGPGGLWERILAVCTAWEFAGRRIPDHWTRG